MSNVYWGIDASNDVRTVIDAVHTFAGAFPSWVGRYLADYALTRAEIAWLHANGSRILPIWNGSLPGDVSSNEAHGQEHGQLAVAAARGLGVPAGVWLPVDIESSWQPSPDFLVGYNNACHAAGYIGGAYLNVLEQSHVDAWRGARARSTVPAYVFTSEPEYNAWRGTLRNEWFDFTTTPLGTAAGDVAAHQYSENELNGAVDFDVCTQMCYDHLLWAPIPHGPVTRIVAKQCALKVAPNHTSHVAIDPSHQHVYLTPGTSVVLTSTVMTNGESWAAVHLTGALLVVHGFVPTANLR